MTNAAEKLSEIYELNELNNFYHDEDITKALMKLTGVLANRDIEAIKVGKHIVDCDALAMLMALKAKYYMTIGKDEPDARDKKNLCLTLREELHTLAQSLKYLVRAQL